MIKRYKNIIKEGSNNFKLLCKIFNPFVIALGIAFFFIVFLFPFKFIPDFFNFAQIENPRTFIWNLVTTTLSFSGLILTVLLVSYNFYLKSTRRNTLEFIIDSPYLKLIFSSFTSLIIIHFLGFFFIKANIKGEKISLLYFLSIVTLLYILLLFPMVILSLKYSNSIKRIQKILNAVTPIEIEYI